MNKLIVLILCAALIVSCSTSPVKVVIDKAFATDSSLKSNVIVFDSKDTFRLGDSSITIELKPGKHSFVLNKDAAKEFTVSDDGGILNLDNQEYVAYEIEYAAKSSGYGGSDFSVNSMAVKSVILIDSFVVIPKSGFSMVSADSSLKKILPLLKQSKNGNYYMGDKERYDASEQIFGLKKFGKDKLFINKFWDYSPGEDIPKTVEIRTSKYSIGRASTTKTAVMHANIFLLLARLTPEEYTVKSIKEIMAGKEDKVKVKEKEDAQMKF